MKKVYDKKRCGKCGKIKFNNEFRIRKSGIQKGSFVSYCRLCEIKYARLWRKSPRGKEFKKRTSKLWRLTPRGKEYEKQCRQSQKYIKYHRLYAKSYSQTPRFKKSQKLWQQSLKGKEWWKSYSQSLKGKKSRKISRKLWTQSQKGRIFYKTQSLNRRLRVKNLTFKTIQEIYEQNIKKYGVLTCYLCLKPILIGKDSLEHKIPINRRLEFPKTKINGKRNLGIAHQSCNSSKGIKTVAEFRAEKN